MLRMHSYGEQHRHGIRAGDCRCHRHKINLRNARVSVSMKFSRSNLTCLSCEDQQVYFFSTKTYAFNCAVPDNILFHGGSLEIPRGRSGF